MKHSPFHLLVILLAAFRAVAGTRCGDNGLLHIDFDPANGTILALRDAAAGQNVSETHGEASLWQMTLLDGTTTRSLKSTDATRFDIHSDAPDELQLTWTGFSVESAKDVVVHTTVRLDKAAPQSHWNLDLQKPAALIVRDVSFPRLFDVSHHDGESLAVPLWTGQCLPNPRAALCTPKGQRMAWSYPGMMAMQCVAYSAADAPGLYAACDDTSAFRKSFAFSGAAPDRVSFECVHYPEGGAEGATEWRLPYSAIVGALRGDWLEAAFRYREWAREQAWASGSRMQRGLTPAWLLDTGMWIWNRGPSAGVLPPACALQDALGLPVRVFWHWWHGCPYDAGFPEYLPPREGEAPFRQAVAEAHRHGVKCIVYMNQRLWGISTDSWRTQHAEAFAVKGENGQIAPEVYNVFTKSPMASMCLATAFWRNTYAGIAERAIVQFGVDGIYMDQACDSMPCYDRTHGHPIGGGRYWLEGFRLLSTDVRARAGDRPITLAGEGCCEAWLPYLDAMLTLQVSKERYSAPSDPWEPIPFFHAVYHPVAITYGSYSSLTMPPYDNLWPKEHAPKDPLSLLDRKFSRQFYLEQARAFTWGQQPTLANFLPNQLTERAEELDYVMRIAKVRHRAEKYLVHGELLHPPRLEAASTTSPFSRLSIYAGQGEHLAESQKAHPLALTTAWRAPDGAVAIAVASVADAALPATLTWEPGAYPIPAPGEIVRIDDAARTVIQRFDMPPTRIDLTLPPRAVWMLEIAPSRP